jgi:hypothetical protein
VVLSGRRSRLAGAGRSSVVGRRLVRTGRAAAAAAAVDILAVGTRYRSTARLSRGVVVRILVLPEWWLGDIRTADTGQEHTEVGIGIFPARCMGTAAAAPRSMEQVLEVGLGAPLLPGSLAFGPLWDLERKFNRLTLLSTCAEGNMGVYISQLCGCLLSFKCTDCWDVGRLNRVQHSLAMFFHDVAVLLGALG